jgi:hypothetical protein
VRRNRRNSQQRFRQNQEAERPRHIPTAQDGGRPGTPPVRPHDLTPEERREHRQAMRQNASQEERRHQKRQRRHQQNQEEQEANR